MSFDPLPSPPFSCPSELMLDRWYANELDADAAKAIPLHAATCASCTARIEERKAGFAALKNIDERRVLAGIRRGLDAPPPRPTLLSRLLSLRVLLALSSVALATALIVALPNNSVLHPPIHSIDEGVRAKGGLALHVFRLRDGHAEESVSGDRFSPGERIRFVVDLPADGFVRVLGVEAGGAVYTAWPLDPAASTSLKAGNAIPLEGAVSLDQSAGRETLYLAECRSSESAAACRTASTVDSAGKPTCPASCALTPFVLDKTR